MAAMRLGIGARNRGGDVEAFHGRVALMPWHSFTARGKDGSHWSSSSEAPGQRAIRNLFAVRAIASESSGPAATLLAARAGAAVGWAQLSVSLQTLQGEAMFAISRCRWGG
jgi:hypothetical protein